jgi:hypothetical protein
MHSKTDHRKVSKALIEGFVRWRNLLNLNFSWVLSTSYCPAFDMRDASGEISAFTWKPSTSWTCACS